MEAEACAREVIEVVPLGIRWLRAAIRAQEPTWSVPQLVTMGFLRDHPGASLSEVAVALGVGLPSASTLITRLVETGQVDRSDDPLERRRNVLTLTPSGEAALAAAIDGGRRALAERMRALPTVDLDRMAQSLAVLRELFGEP
ncbi:MAG TPA: MarR family transcriptional regulator [Acidimicrobiia bacterium]|nr:MarR family transcriptional regulator [Acidimicrobiia bacterium]